MFERFTEKSRAIVVQAQDEARRMGHNFVGTEQILLGMLADGDNAAANILVDQSINLETARQEVENIIGLGAGSTDVEIPFTPRSKYVFELGLEEAEKLEHEYIEPKHLLLGIMLENEGVAAAVIRKLADSSDTITQCLYQQLSA